MNITLQTSALPQATVGQLYSQQITASGGNGSYAFSATGLPAWLTLTPAGVLSGTPSAVESDSFQVTVTDSAGNQGVANCTLSVVAVPPPPPPGSNRFKPSGINTASLQYQGSGYSLAEWFPMWVNDPAANAVGLKAGLVGTPSNILNANDPVFGWVFKGDGTPRKYTVPYSQLLDFARQSSRAFGVSCWVKCTIPASQLTNSNNPPNGYCYSFDNPSPPYDGHSLALARQFAEPNQGHIVTEFAVDGSSAQVSDFGNKVVNDGFWNLIDVEYPWTGNGSGGHVVGTIGVDGVLDVQSNGSLQDLLFPDLASPGTSQPLYIGTDDDGQTSCCNWLMCDLRFYYGTRPATVKAAQYAQATRFELYLP